MADFVAPRGVEQTVLRLTQKKIFNSKCFHVDIITDEYGPTERLYFIVNDEQEIAGRVAIADCMME